MSRGGRANSERLSGDPSPGRVAAIMPILVTTRFSCTGSQRSALTPGNDDQIIVPAKARRQRPFDLSPIFDLDVVLDDDDEL